ncbi:MAG: Rieske 2Fe-2S domain-containing protein [Candidatus Acidiferrales bacterium]
MQAKLSSKAARLPAVEDFPAYPASWYLFCRSAQLDEKPLLQRMLGRKLVAFRTASGRVTVMDGSCAHMGADLGCGSVVGETIRCPFHHWRYGTDGVCQSVPNQRQVPAFARLRTYPVEERHGYVFFFNGSEALFPLPFMIGADPADFIAGEMFEYVADCTWFMNSAHAFDTQHFAAVHERKLLGPPSVDCPAPFARRNTYRAEVIGESVFDRILRVVAGRTVEITLTIWGGNVGVITADFRRVRSGFLIAMQPLEDGQTLCQGIVYARMNHGLRGLLDPVNLWLRRLFTFGYLAEEARRLRGTHYQPASLGEVDKDMIEYFQWAASMPQSGPCSTNPNEKEENDENLARKSDVPVHRGTVRVVASAS